jgi:predicted MFS family arabinose efflux permease
MTAAGLPASRDWRTGFFFLWAAAITSQMANFLMLLTLSVRIFSHTHSSFSASIIFALQWIAPALFGRVIRWVCESFAPHRSLIAIECLSMVATAALGWAGELPAWCLPLLLVPRGVLEGAGKAVRLVAAKQIIPAARLRTFNPLLNTALPLGTALASLLGAVLIDWLDVHSTALVCCTLALVAGTLSLFVGTGLPAAASGGGVARWSVFTIIRRKATLARPLVLLAITVGVFQSYHNVARTTYPLQFLGLPESSAMGLQVVSSSAIILGAIAVSWLARRRWLPSDAGVSWIVGACALMCAVAQLRSPAIGYAAYFAFMFVFEVAFCRYQTAMVEAADATEIGAVSSFINALLPVTMGVMIAVLAFLIDHLGFVLATWLTAIATAITAAALHLRRGTNTGAAGPALIHPVESKEHV